MFRFSFSGTRNIIFGTLKIGQNDPEIPNLEFESHGFLQNHVYLPTEQAETNICWIIYQDATFKICLSLFGWKVNIVPKMHIVHWGYTIMLSKKVNTSIFRISKWQHTGDWQVKDRNTAFVPKVWEIDLSSDNKGKGQKKYENF